MTRGQIKARPSYRGAVVIGVLLFLVVTLLSLTNQMPYGGTGLAVGGLMVLVAFLAPLIAGVRGDHPARLER